MKFWRETVTQISQDIAEYHIDLPNILCYHRGAIEHRNGGRVSAFRKSTLCLSLMSHKYPVQKLRRILLCRSYIALLPGERERRIIMKNYQVIKRSGSITAFDLHKISAAIEKPSVPGTGSTIPL